ncbi:MAG: hypothetical protein VKK32_01545 [Candidatus Melainabacteria bacterium]|nr:hypothetical protein [Candidatus Melainabacteria bacterium]
MAGIVQTIKKIPQDIGKVKTFLTEGLRAVAPLTADTIDATREFLNLNIPSNQDYARVLIDIIQQQPEKIKWGPIGGGLRDNAVDVLNKLRETSLDEQLPGDLRASATRSLKSILDTANLSLKSPATSVENIVLANNSIEALVAAGEILATTAFRGNPKFFSFFSKANKDIEANIDATLNNQLKGYDPQVKEFYKAVAKSEILNIFENSERILIGDEYADFRRDPRSRDLVNNLRAALAEKFKVAIPEEAKNGKEIKPEYTILVKMTELVKHAPGSRLYNKAKEELLSTVNDSAERQFIIEERIATINKSIQERQEKIDKGLGDENAHQEKITELRDDLKQLTQKHNTLLNVRGKQAELIEKTWLKMESLTGSRALQESLQNELFQKIVDGKRQIDKESVKSLFPHDEWSPLTDPELSVRELIHAYHSRSGENITINLHNSSATAASETVTYDVHSAQGHMIAQFAQEEDKRNEALAEKLGELEALTKERKSLEESFHGSNAGKLMKGLFAVATSDTSQKRFSVLNQNLGILSARGNDNAADLNVLIQESKGRFSDINSKLDEVLDVPSLKTLSEDPAYVNTFRALRSGNYDRSNVTGIIDDLEKFIQTSQRGGILDQNQEERLKEVINTLKIDQQAVIKEVVLINKVYAYEAKQEDFISRRAGDSAADRAAKTINLDGHLNIDDANLAKRLVHYETLATKITDLDGEVKVLADDDSFYNSLEQKRTTYFNNFVLRSSEIKFDNLVTMGLTDPQKADQQVLEPLKGILDEFIVEKQSNSELVDVLRALMAYILDFAGNFISLPQGLARDESKVVVDINSRRKPPVAESTGGALAA